MRKIVILPAVIAALLLGSGLTGTDTISGPDKAEASTSTVYWGPFEVPGNSQPSVTGGVAAPCVDCYITGITPDLEYRSVDNPPLGSPPGPEDVWATSDFATGGMLHHMVLFNHAYVDPTCAGDPLFGSLGERFFASGNERGTLTFPAGYGYYLPVAGPDNYWVLNRMVHNVSPSNKWFRLKMDFTHVPGTDGLRKVHHLWLDENNCDTSQYGVPAGYSDTHWDWTSGTVPAQTADDVEGTIIEIGGHVHDFGMSVSAEKLQTGEWICTSTAGYAMGSAYDPAAVASPPRPNDAGHPEDAVALNPGDPAYDGHIEAMTGCATNLKIAPGDTIRLHAQYDPDASVCDTSPPYCVDDVMGIMGAWIYDNCAAVSNPNQHDNDSDLLGDVCDADADGDSILNDTDTDDDGDGALDTWEIGCGTEPLHGGRKQPERLDAVFALTDDDADTLVNEALPAGSANLDCDGDGYKGDGTGVGNISEKRIYTAGGTANDQDACGNTGWPADLVSSGTSANKITLTDVSSYIASPKKFGTDPGDTGYDVRWDLVTGNGAGLPKDIALTDLSNITTLVPPMLGVKAFGGPVCPWTP